MVDQGVDRNEVDRFKSQMTERDRHMEAVREIARTIDNITLGRPVDAKQTQVIFDIYFKEYSDWIRKNTQYAQDVFFTELQRLEHERQLNDKTKGNGRIPEFKTKPITPESIGDIFAWYFSRQLSETSSK